MQEDSSDELADGEASALPHGDDLTPEEWAELERLTDPSGDGKESTKPSVCSEMDPATTPDLAVPNPARPDSVNDAVRAAPEHTHEVADELRESRPARDEPSTGLGERSDDPVYVVEESGAIDPTKQDEGAATSTEVVEEVNGELRDPTSSANGGTDEAEADGDRRTQDTPDLVQSSTVSEVGDSELGSAELVDSEVGDSELGNAAVGDPEDRLSPWAPAADFAETPNADANTDALQDDDAVVELIESGELDDKPAIVPADSMIHAKVVEAVPTDVESDQEEREPLADGESASKAEDPGTDEETGAAQPEDAAETRPSLQMALPRVIAIANQKGGVGKTTTTVNIAACLAEQGYRTLLVDLDPQANASTGLGIDSRQLDHSVYDVLLHDHAADSVIEPTETKNLFVLPSSLDLAGAEIELVPMLSREHRLRLAIESVLDDFDYVLIDCPPSLGLLTINALTAAREVLVPIQCEYYALEGLGQLMQNVELVRASLNPELLISHIVLVMFDPRTKLAGQVVDEVRAHFGSTVCDNVIPRTVRLSEAPSFGQPITTFDSGSRGAAAYRAVTQEVLGGQA